MLVERLVAATWRITRQKGTATLLVETFRPLAKQTTASIAAGGAPLLDVAAADDAHEIQFTPAS